MRRRTHLRTRVLLLTGAFALALFAITIGVSWRATASQQRWSDLMSVDNEAIEALDTLITQQNAFRAQLANGSRPAYTEVTQIVDGSRALRTIDTRILRAKMRAFATIAADPASRPEDVEATSNAVVLQAAAMINDRRAVIRANLKALERDTRALKVSGIALAWIVAILSFAAAQSTKKSVVGPIEDLSRAAAGIAAGNVNAKIEPGGDDEIYRLGKALSEMRDKLRDHARTDELTSLPNFRAFRERIEDEISRAARYEFPFGILVLDLDHFKKYNDTYGHLAGNEALQRVATAIRETVRVPDFAARYGGEEFAVILPESDGAAAYAVAERVRAAIEALPAPRDGSVVTVSIGAAMFPQDGRNPEALFHAADERLYVAKKEGRNRVVIAAAESAATA